MKYKQILLLSLIAASTLSNSEFSIAAELPKTMSKISVRVIEPKFPQDSFQALPKTFYRATRQYMRSEEALDREMNIRL